MQFLQAPAAWADPDLAGHVLAPGLRPETVRALLAACRTAPQANAILAKRLGRGDMTLLAAADQLLALAGAEGLRTVASLAGAIWHAPRVRALVMGGDIAALAARHGDVARLAAMRHATLAGPAGEIGDLADDIARDGTACIDHWIDTLPAWAAARLRLISPPHGVSLPEPARAVQIVRAAAAMVAA